jgi:hypothetical protein
MIWPGCNPLANKGLWCRWLVFNMVYYGWPLNLNWRENRAFRVFGNLIRDDKRGGIKQGF